MPAANDEPPRPTLSICVPVYDEAENLPLLHAAVVAAADPIGLAFELILVDDASKDASWEAIRALAGRDPRVRGLKFAANCGETAASDAGMRAARGRFVMTMDADLQNDPKDIPGFLAALDQGWDCVCGTRVATRGKGDSKVKVISSRIANWVRNKMSKETISDAGCTYRAFRRECVDKLKLYRGLHRFIPTLLKMEGFTVTEIPVTNNPRLHGESKYGVWNRLFKSFRDLLAIRWMKSRLLGYQVEQELNGGRAEPPGGTGYRGGARRERGGVMGPTPAIPANRAAAFAVDWYTAWNAHDLDAICAHYADDVEFTSPFVARLADPSGTVRGITALRAYFAAALAAYPGLRFVPISAAAGVGSIVLVYHSVRGLTAAEVMEFDGQGTVRRVLAHYAER